MEEREQYTRNKGGRPAKAIKRNKLIGVRCSTTEQFLIEAKAKAARLTKSEFLRILGLTGKIDIQKKVIPKEVLIAVADLNHLAANMNQIAKKRNSNDDLNAFDRAEINVAVDNLKEFVTNFKNHFK